MSQGTSNADLSGTNASICRWLDSFIAVYTAWTHRPPVIFAEGRNLDRCLNGSPQVNLRGAHLWTIGPAEVPGEPFVPRPWITADIEQSEGTSARIALRRHWSFWTFSPDLYDDLRCQLPQSHHVPPPQPTEVFGGVTDMRWGRKDDDRGCDGMVVMTRFTEAELGAFARNDLSSLAPVRASPLGFLAFHLDPWRGPPSTSFGPEPLPAILAPNRTQPPPRHCDAHGILPPEVVLPPPDWDNWLPPAGSLPWPSGSGGDELLHDGKKEVRRF